MPVKKKTNGAEIEAIKHTDKRTNIPTEELRGFVAEDENAPKKMLYPRDPSLDPQLVWKGKDEQDQQDFEVPVVPIYIQEKIQPQAIIENLRVETSKDSPGQLGMNLFADFNGIKFDDLVDFYRHEQNWTNRMILGDSLLVMTSLAEKEGLKGKVQTIYIDPPYGIKFGSNWQVSTRKRDVKDGRVEDLTRQPEQIRAFRDTWELGIHSYLAYLRDRLVAARELLTESGSIFVQIGDENVHLVRCLLDEVFGSENFIAQIPFAKTSGYATTFLTGICDYLLWYGKDRDRTKYRQLNSFKQAGEVGASKYNRVMLPGGESRPLTTRERSGDELLPPGSRLWVDDNLTSQGNPLFSHSFRNKSFGGTYKTTAAGLTNLAMANRLYAAEGSLRYIRFIDDFPAVPLNAAWMDIGGIQSRVDPKIYVVQTAVEAAKRCILMTTDPGDLVLDPTCGSGTTAYVAEQWGRRWITCDTSRVALALARTRLMSAKFQYYLLADSPEGMAKEAELTGQPAPPISPNYDVKKGFVYERVPHITLKSIANNEEIDIIHAKWEEKLEPIRARLNKLSKRSYEEWQVPREPEKDWPKEANDLLNEWWRLKRERQKETDASISKRADTELLYDKPYEDKKRIRVSGPFTVESLSPHRMLPAANESDGQDGKPPQSDTSSFVNIVLENMRKFGVQNTFKNERLKFDYLEPFAGTYIHAVGEYTESDGKLRRAAIHIGPEFGTVTPDDLKEAAKEAIRGIGYDILIICGLSFDSYLLTEKEALGKSKQLGKLTILLSRMNPDLLIGDSLLKKTGAGNLFMVFGEPDVAIQKSDGKITVKINGVDVYDPTTGQIRSSSTSDIACWFVDTNYNNESFFVRHAYFTGADQPYEKLKRALKAEIDEAAWSALYATKSYPFDTPKTGKIAVKVINHYGDEVLKVYGVQMSHDG